MRILIAIFATAITLALADTAHAAANVEIYEITCFPGHSQDFIKIRNSGDAPQNLAGWQARSDPEATQHFDLGNIGSIPSGGEIILNAGLHSVNLPAENLYQWSIGEVLRDDDPYDYARIVDANGNQVTGMRCNGQPVDLSVPTPVPTPKPDPTPTPVPAPTAPPAPNEIGPQLPSAVRGGTNQPNTNAVVADTAGNPLGEAVVPAGGGPPLAEQGNGELMVALGVTAILAGATLVSRGRNPKSGSEARE